MAQNPDKVAQVRAKPTLLGWFVGQAMKATGGKANPQAVNAVLKAKLDKVRPSPLDVCHGLVKDGNFRGRLIRI